EYHSIKLRSLVGVIALFPAFILDLDQVKQGMADAFKDRMDWFWKKHPELLDFVTTDKNNANERLLLCYGDPARFVRILSMVFDEAEFLSPHGIRGISQRYRDRPFSMNVDGAVLSEQYVPAESADGAFGGNSNWRGPVWFPINFMLIEKLRIYHSFFGDSFLIEYPSRSGNRKNLQEIADDLGRRMIAIFEQDHSGRRPVHGGNATFQSNPKWKDLLLFYEYFHGDNGAGIGASHQTGWTGLVAELLQQTKSKNLS
ncbi:MAG: glucosidase, partial [Opitutaceae bacterium]|nr:glucosidase [Verrucomicrobiales bacterium]